MSTSSTESNAGRYNKLLPRAYGPLRILQVTELILTVEENVIPSATSIDRVTPVKRSISHLGRFKESRTFLEEKTTLFETVAMKEAGISSPMLKWP